VQAVKVKAAAPDGKTLLLTPVAPMSVYQHGYKSLAYDPARDGGEAQGRAHCRGTITAHQGAPAGRRSPTDRHHAAELGSVQKADSELWAPAVKASGFTPEQ